MLFTVNSAMEHLSLPEAMCNAIVAAYRPRKYHNLEHLDNMLRWVDVDHIQSFEMDMRSVLSGILFHDLYYEVMPIMGFNEAMSVSMYSMLMSPQMVSEEAIAELASTVSVITATAYHHTDQKTLTDEAAYVCDLDLQSFARPREEFLADTLKVQEEYLEAGVSEEDFKLGNKAFLSKLLARKQIYYMIGSWEEPARENIAWRISTL